MAADDRAWLEWRAALVGRLSDAVEQALRQYTGESAPTGATATEAPGYDPAGEPVALLCDVEIDGRRRVFRVTVSDGLEAVALGPCLYDESLLLEARQEAIQAGVRADRAEADLAELKAELRRACTQRQDAAAEAGKLRDQVERLKEQIGELEAEADGFNDHDDPDCYALLGVRAPGADRPKNDVEMYGEVARFARESGCPDCSLNGGPVEALAAPSTGWEWRCPSCGGFWVGPAPTSEHPQISAERCKAVPDAKG